VATARRYYLPCSSCRRRRAERSCLPEPALYRAVNRLRCTSPACRNCSSRPGAGGWSRQVCQVFSSCSQRAGEARSCTGTAEGPGCRLHLGVVAEGRHRGAAHRSQDQAMQAHGQHQTAGCRTEIHRLRGCVGVPPGCGRRGRRAAAPPAATGPADPGPGRHGNGNQITSRSGASRSNAASQGRQASPCNWPVGRKQSTTGPPLTLPGARRQGPHRIAAHSRQHTSRPCGGRQPSWRARG
jgi:hypothetical protein